MAIGVSGTGVTPYSPDFADFEQDINGEGHKQARRTGPNARIRPPSLAKLAIPFARSSMFASDNYSVG
jgi:hypothetical protein